MANKPIDWEYIKQLEKEGVVKFTPESEKLRDEILKRVLNTPPNETDQLPKT